MDSSLDMPILFLMSLSLVLVLNLLRSEIHGIKKDTEELGVTAALNGLLL